MAAVDSTNRDKGFLKQLEQIVLENLHDEQFGVHELAQKSGICRSYLYRKLHLLTGQSASQFIREIRLREAYQLLQKENLTASEVAYRVGFNTPSYFNSCFHDFYGFPPGQIKHQHENHTRDHIPEVQVNKRERFRLWGASKRVMLITALLFLTIAAVISYAILKNPGLNEKEISIAVLPFSDDSPDKNYSFIIDGLMEEILYKFSMVSNLRVVSRTSVEKYRDYDANIKEIGKELDVDYILEGSAQTIHNVTRIRLQLIETETDRHLWSRPFEREVRLDNIFEVQNELAQRVLEEVGSFLSHEEKKLLTKKPTHNLAAYNKYLWGLDYLRLFEQSPMSNSYEELPKAKHLFEEAIMLDSSFSEAYVQLGDIYLNKMLEWGNIYVNESLLDTGLMMANKALQYDENNWKALALKGQYYLSKGMLDKANAIFAVLPDNAPAVHQYYEKAFHHFFLLDDAYNTIKYFLKYEEFVPDDAIINPTFYHYIAWHFTYAGYTEIAGEYARKMLQQNNDSVAYFNLMSMIETMSGNYEKAMEYSFHTYRIDSANTQCLYYLMISSIWLRDYQTAYKYLNKYGGKYLNSQSGMLIGFVYLKNGMPEKAEQHFTKTIKILNDEIKMNSWLSSLFYSHSYLACVCCVMGDKEKALEYLLSQKNRRTIHLYLIISMKEFPMLERIRSEPEFAEVLADMEEKYNRDHARVGKLLKEKGMLE